MKKLLVLLVLGTLALPAVAQDVAGEITVHGYATDRPVASREFQKEMRQYNGIYLMSNGQTMVLSQVGHELYAKLGEGGERALVGLTSGDLVTRDRSMRIRPERDFSNYFIGNVVVEVTSDAVAGMAPAQPLFLVGAR